MHHPIRGYSLLHKDNDEELQNLTLIMNIGSQPALWAASVRNGSEVRGYHEGDWITCKVVNVTQGSEVDPSPSRLIRQMYYSAYYHELSHEILA